jgi:nucleotide-binding universal stress UspA family protein
MYKRVLVPLDGSRLAEGILPFVLQMTAPHELDVVLVRVERPIPPNAIEGTTYFTVDDIAARRRKAREYLAEVAAGLRRRGLRVAIDARYGDPVAEILAAAGESGADVIAMTTHGRTGVTRLLFGSVAEAVLRRARVPVLVMRVKDEHRSAVEVA